MLQKYLLALFVFSFGLVEASKSQNSEFLMISGVRKAHLYFSVEAATVPSLKKINHLNAQEDYLPPIILDNPFKINQETYLPFYFSSILDDIPPRKGHKNRFIRVSIAPVVLMGLGLFTNKDDGLLNREDFREVWNTLFPDFNDDVNDIAQYYPIAWTFLTKIVGLKGRHSLGRATSAITIAAFLAGSTVFALKHSVIEERPESQFSRAFPSAQTTTAFLGATFMHKELNVISPVYSVVAYTIATIVGVYRQLNDLHWISDVLFGAGLGIGAMEMGYIINDEIFGSKGTNPLPVRSFFDRPMFKPSFLTYKLGYAQLLGDVDEIRSLGFQVRSGFSFGNEGTFFFNRWFGVGGEFAVGSFPINKSDFVLQNPNLIEVNEEIDTDALGVLSAYFGPYINVPLQNTKVALVFKVAAGLAEGANGGVKIRLKDEYIDTFNAKELTVLGYEPDRAFGMSSSLFLRILVSRVIGFSAFVNYNYSNPEVTVTEITDVNPATGAVTEEVIFTGKQNNQFYSVGFSVFGMLWGGKFGN